MSSSRVDVQRLFGHFGLDPARYVDLSGAAATRSAGAPQAAPSGARTERLSPESANADIFDYRNFDLGR